MKQEHENQFIKEENDLAQDQIMDKELYLKIVILKKKLLNIFYVIVFGIGCLSLEAYQYY